MPLAKKKRNYQIGGPVQQMMPPQMMPPQMMPQGMPPPQGMPKGMPMTPQRGIASFNDGGDVSEDVFTSEEWYENRQKARELLAIGKEKAIKLNEKAKRKAKRKVKLKLKVKTVKKRRTAKQKAATRKLVALNKKRKAKKKKR